MRVAGILTSIALLASACGDPLAGVPRISDVDLAETDPAASAVASEAEVAREGFFGTSAAEGTPAAASEAAAVPATEKPVRRRGLLSVFRSNRTAPAPAGAAEPLSQEAFDAAKAAENDTVGASTELAAIEPEPQPGPAPKRGGFFSRLTGTTPATEAPRSGIDAMEVTYGEVLPYGLVARVCDAKGKSLGRKVENASASGFELYDSNPSATGSRTFYITGFADNCPRQLTASQVLLGAPSLYEQLHYGPGGEFLPVGETDNAYETVKGQVCGVRKGKPCGSRINRLERSTFFVNTYARPSDNTSWSELLIHDGQVIAASVKNAG